MRNRTLVPVLTSLLLAGGSAAARAQEPTWMRGLDALLSAEVTSVSRKEQRLADTSAAVFVLTRDDIQRSGLRSVANLLRLVPGLHVAQADGNKWAVSSRGMNSRWAKHLLVMIDGRSIYTPYYAGVFWDAVDVPVEIIERIEVVRGPGASIWGANAVNGVINIITASDSVKRETAVTGGLGSQDFGSVVHAGRIGDLVGYRLFATATEHAPFELPAGVSAQDGWRERSLGGSFRATLNSRDTLEGSARGFASRSDYLAGELTDLVPYTFTMSPFVAKTETWNASARWTRQLTGGGSVQTEAWMDEWWRHDEAYDHHRRTADVSFQYRPGVHRGHDLIAGAGFRQTHDTTRGSLWTRLTPESDTHRITSAFVQDEIALAGSRAHLVLGTKVEHRDHIGWRAQPTARLHWRFAPTRSAWAAVSRAMRAPDRIEQDVFMNAFGMPWEGMDWVFTIQGNLDAQPEWLTAYEAGYRTVLGGALTLDLAAYYNRYSGLQTSLGGMPQFAMYNGRPYVEFPSTYANLLWADTAGGEAVAVFAPAARWKVTGSYSLFSYEPEFHAPAVDFGTDGGGAPRHQAQLRYSVELPRAVDADLMLFASSAMPKPAFDVPAHARVDSRIAWRPASPLELAFVVQNLTGHEHPEMSGLFSGLMQPSHMRRSAYGTATWKF